VTGKLVSHKASRRAKAPGVQQAHAEVRRRVTADSQSDAAQEIVASQTQEQSVKSPPGLAGATSEKRRAPGASSFRAVACSKGVSTRSKKLGTQSF
jgi:hypothetical protein